MQSCTFRIHRRCLLLHGDRPGGQMLGSRLTEYSCGFTARAFMTLLVTCLPRARPPDISTICCAQPWKYCATCTLRKLCNSYLSLVSCKRR